MKPEIRYHEISTGGIPSFTKDNRSYFPMEVSFIGPSKKAVLDEVYRHFIIAPVETSTMHVFFRGDEFETSPQPYTHKGVESFYGYFSMLAETTDGKLYGLAYQDQLCFVEIGGTQ